jgi:uncharacterized membrane protein YbaN (DUF454 family)
MKQLTLIGLGWIFTLVGIAGVVVPILPGIPVFLTGLILLGRHYAWARRLIALLRAKARKLAREHNWQRRTAYLWLVRRLDFRRRALS